MRSPFLIQLATDELAMQYAIIYPDKYDGVHVDPNLRLKASRIYDELRIRTTLAEGISLIDQARETLVMIGLSNDKISG